MTLAERIGAITGVPVAGLRAVSGGDICAAYRVDLADGRRVFAKQAPTGSVSMMTTEAAGLAWLAQGGAPTPDIIGHDEELLVLSWVAGPAGGETASVALGRALARLHRAGAPSFGAAPPRAAAGWIGSAPMSYADWPSWPQFFVQERILPYLRAAAARGAVDRAEAGVIEAVCDRIDALAGPPVPPARLHGDLWAGNIIFGPGGAVLIDPAAHGGHPESDIAMLHLFAPQQLDRIVAGYESVAALAAGWRQRLDLHQLYPLLVHAALFGGGYGSAAAAAARRLLRR